MMIKTTQKELVLAYLTHNEWISPAEAWEHLGISRLSAVIWDLIHEGTPIIKSWREVTNRYGKKTEVRVYRLAKEGELNG